VGRGMPPGEARERPISLVDRGEGRIKAPRWCSIFGRTGGVRNYCFPAHAYETRCTFPQQFEPFPSLRTRSEWARSLWIVECCSASRIARDLEGAVEHERLIDYALLRAKSQDLPTNHGGWTRRVCQHKTRLNRNSRNEFFNNNWNI